MIIPESRESLDSWWTRHLAAQEAAANARATRYDAERDEAPYPLYHPPACGRCGRDLTYEDGWECRRCHLAYGSSYYGHIDEDERGRSMCDYYGEHDRTLCWGT